MRAIRHSGLLLTLLAAAACTSAMDRFEQGVELQNQGRWMEAAYRYADAYDRDSELTEARDRLIVAADSATRIALRTSIDLDRQGRHVDAADQFEQVDRLVARGREVGVRLETPADYTSLRRAAFDQALAGLLDRAAELRGRGEWLDARRMLVQARTRFEPSAQQRDRAIDTEVDLLLGWGAADLLDQRYRTAFGRAQEALDLKVPARRQVVTEARRIQTRALDLGTVAVGVLPVTSRAPVLELVGTAYETQLSDDLELDFWRDPPPFIVVVDPVQVRREIRLVRRAGRPLSTDDIADVLGAVGADFGALVEVASVTFTESDVEREVRQGRTRDGRPMTYEVLRGRLTVDVMIDVVVIDPRGREVTGRTVRMSERGTFERGEFAGDYRDLELTRNELRLFDRDALAEQQAALDQAILAALVPEVADRVFDAVLSRIP